NPPSVETTAVSSLTQTKGTLNANVNPNGGSVSDCHFEYGSSSSYGSSLPCSSLPGSGSSAVAVSANVEGLSANATYHFRVVAGSQGGTGTGTDQTFTMLPNPPTITLVSPSVGPLAGGTLVTIAGTDLTGATAVKFG